MKKDKGITLIALIVTIVIMLILATVTVNVAINGKLFGTAKEAVDKTNDKVGQTQNRVDELLGELNNIMGEGTGGGNYNVEIANFRQSRINLNDAIALLQTAEGAMASSDTILQNLYPLAVQITNPTYTPDEISEMIPEINAFLEEIDRTANGTIWQDIYIVNGSLSGESAYIVNLVTRQLTLEIDGIRRQDLGLEQIGDLTAEEERNELVQKIYIAIDKISSSRIKLQSKQNLYEYLVDYYKSAEEILSQNLSVDITKDQLAINGMNKIVVILERVKFIEEKAINSMLTTNDKEAILREINETMVGINIIAEDLEFKGQKLLNGSYKNIPNLNTVGLSQNGVEFYVDLSTQDSITKSISECENAINLIENLLKEM